MVPELVAREEVVAYARSHEGDIKQRLLERFVEWLRLPFPERGFEKYLAAKEVYGPFDINQDWLQHEEDEFMDSFLYEATDHVKQLRS